MARVRNRVLSLGVLLGALCLLSSDGQAAGAVSGDPAAIIRACDADPARCDAASVPPDRTETLDNHVQSRQSYEWLRSGLQQMGKANPQDRHRRTEVLLRHLQEGQPATSAIASSQARRAADAVLANVEFARAKPSWLQRQWERLQAWLDRHTRLPSASTSNLLRFILEALLFAVPLLLLGLWVLRQIREERLRPAESGSREAQASRSRTDWLQAAGAFAARQQWREAVHAMYWHGISTLEQQRVVAPSRTRTPREYLSLLPPGTTRRTRLRELTLLLESSWYGDGPSSESDYLRATTLAQQVGTA